MPSEDPRRLYQLLQSLVKILQELPESDRPIALREFVRDSLEIAFDAGFHFSQFCDSLADFAAGEAEHWPRPEVVTWRNTAALLRSAALEAETEGRELP